MNRDTSRNILFLHLESLSQMAFWQYSSELPTLFSLMKRSASFSRFYVASTSSVMSLCDFLHGDSSVMDHLEVFPRERNWMRTKSSNLFHILHELGYASFATQYGSFCLGDAPSNFWGIWPDVCGQFRWHNNPEEFRRETRDFLEGIQAQRRPFAMYFWNMNTHLRDNSPGKPRTLPYHERFRVGCRLLDDAVKQLLDDISDLGFLENTVIVAFGDHGDDLWRHGIYRGRSHLIDPYSSVSWCPLFIYDNGCNAGTFTPLLSIVDLKSILLHMLFPGRKPESPQTPFAGINTLSVHARAVAYTQSMFALQRERSDPSKAITKSYAVTDGQYRLMASAPGDSNDSGGMELFLEQWDYGNTLNLLEFFELDDEGNPVPCSKVDAVYPYFSLTSTDKSLNHTAQRYVTLRNELQRFIKLKEQYASQYFLGESMHLFPNELFSRVRRRGH